LAFQKKGGRRNRAKSQGTRSDLSGDGKSLDTAQLFGEEYNVSDRAIRDMGRFYQAVEVLQGTVQAKSRILHESLPLSRDEIIQIADQPDEDHRDLWALALASRKDLQYVLKKRGKARPRRGPSAQRQAAPSAAERYDLVELVRIIGSNWPQRAVAELELDERKLGILADHLDAAIGSLRHLQRMVSVKDAA
jgi:hypothetical protein